MMTPSLENDYKQWVELRAVLVIVAVLLVIVFALLVVVYLGQSKTTRTQDRIELRLLETERRLLLLNGKVDKTVDDVESWWKIDSRNLMGRIEALERETKDGKN